jgi:uncharacterized repeat protein (TIGR03803 family)
MRQTLATRGLCALHFLLFIAASLISNTAAADPVLTTIYSFSGTDGAKPDAPLYYDWDADLYYGTTTAGGRYGLGTLFKITKDGALTVLHDFNGTDGASPRGMLVDGPDDALYGTTSDGGSSGLGTLFRVTRAGFFTTLHSFSGGKLEGSRPMGGLVYDGDLYGVTNRGGLTDEGTVFKATLDGAVTTLHSFLGIDGSYPEGGLVFDGSGNLYGTTVAGGDYGDGTVYKIGLLDRWVKTLHSFSRFVDGAAPRSTLTGMSQMYGTTSAGGVGDQGTLFSITAGGVLTTLHAFVGSEGAGPIGSPVRGTDGAVYGATAQGSTGGKLYRWTPTGAFNVVTSLSPLSVANALAFDFDGNWFGVSAGGGDAGNGAVFRYGTPPLPVVELHSDLSSAAIGQTIHLTWSARFAQSCTASGAWSGVKAVPGGATDVVVQSAGQTAFYLNCSGVGGFAGAYVVVQVGPPTLPVVTFEVAKEEASPADTTGASSTTIVVTTDQVPPNLIVKVPVVVTGGTMPSTDFTVSSSGVVFYYYSGHAITRSSVTVNVSKRECGKTLVLTLGQPEHGAGTLGAITTNTLTVNSGLLCGKGIAGP